MNDEVMVSISRFNLTYVGEYFKHQYLQCVIWASGWVEKSSQLEGNKTPYCSKNTHALHLGPFFWDLPQKPVKNIGTIEWLTFLTGSVFCCFLVQQLSSKTVLKTKSKTSTNKCQTRQEKWCDGLTAGPWWEQVLSTQGWSRNPDPWSALTRARSTRKLRAYFAVWRYSR